MLSFYLCGMNAVDIYHLDEVVAKESRIEYNRSKTTGNRADEAFISIAIVPEARLLLARYAGQLKNRYTHYTGLDSALSKGMKQLRDLTGLQNITFYWARHSFATIARNKCNISKDDIAEALNHADADHRITDIYIEKSWAVVDRVQNAVMRYLRSLDKKPFLQQSDTVLKRKVMRIVC